MPHAQNFETPRATSTACSLAQAPVWAVALALLLGCGAAPVERPKTKMAPYAAEPDSLRYPQSLRQAALGRVHQRAGFDALAAEYFRSAYRAYPELGYVLDYAQASERARHFAEAHAAYGAALQHHLSEAQRHRIQGEVERLKTLVSPSLVPVTVQVQPYGARVVFLTQGEGQQRRRVMLGDGSLWLRPGTYQIEGSADQHHGLKRTFRVGTHDRQLLSIHLRRQTLTSSNIAGSAAAGGAVAPKKGLIKAAPAQAEAAQASPEEAAAAAAIPTPAPAEGAPTTQPDDPVVAKAAPDEALVQPETPGEGAQAAVTPPPPEEDDDPAGAEEIIEEEAPAPAGGGGNATWGPAITAGLGVAALAAGGVFGYLAITHAGYANDLNPKSSSYKKNLAQEGALAQDNADYATWAFIGGGALVGAGTVWFILDRALGSSAGAPPRSGSAVALRPVGLGYDGRRLLATWRF